jgi:thioredoxin reductase
LLGYLLENLHGAGVGLFFIIATFFILKRVLNDRKAKKLFKKTLEKNIAPNSLYPKVDYSKCGGCGTCTKVCPEGEVLKLINHKSVLVKPEKCVGHGVCERVCPNNAITLVIGTKERGRDIPRISENFETNVPGLYIAGELGGMGLISNAAKQGVFAATHALRERKSKKPKVYDLLIIGAGPAGFSAALTAIHRKVKYALIDQNSLGGTINNFPKQKIVMTIPLILPIVGKVKFQKNKVLKEELLEKWREIKDQTGMKVHEKIKFDSLVKKGEIFYVKTSAGVLKAHKVILALGVRGSPRKLGLENEDLPSVAYELIDAAQYKRNAITIVGAGNSAAEAAAQLARRELKNNVTLVVRKDTLSSCNEENKEIVENLQRQGELAIKYSSNVTGITDDQVTIKGPEGENASPCDYLFIFAGAEMPFKFLMKLGIIIDKKFGESISDSKAERKKCR